MLKYLHIPYEKNGRAHTGADCYGLVYLIEKEVFGKEIPEFAGAIDTREISLIIDQSRPLLVAQQVVTPQDGDLVLFFIRNTPVHIGIIWDGGIIHTSEKRGVVYEKLSSHYLKRFTKKEYYHV